MQKVKSKVEICKLPSMTLVFLPRYWEARKLSPNPRWSPSQGIPRKGQAPGRVTPWIAPGLPHAQVGLRFPSSKPFPDCSPSSSLSSFRPNRRGPCSLRYTVVATSHTRLVWSHKTTSPSPAEYKHGVRKYLWLRGMQTSLNTRPKPRAIA
jgi:hypothetical protein